MDIDEEEEEANLNDPETYDEHFALINAFLEGMRVQ